MRLVDRLRRLETELDAAGMVMQADEVTSAIERIEAAASVADFLGDHVNDGSLKCTVCEGALSAYRSLAEKQDGGE